jgi:hypothetical protein
MARPPRNRSSTAPATRVDLTEKGWMAVVAGLFLLVVMPGFAQGEIARWLRPAMRSVGAVALLVGLVLLLLALSQARKRKRAAVDEQIWARGESGMGFGQHASVATPAVSASSRDVPRHPAAEDETAVAVAVAVAGAAEAEAEAEAEAASTRAMLPNAMPVPATSAGSPGWADTELVHPDWPDTEFAAPAWADTELLDHDNPVAAPVVAAAPADAAQATPWNATVLAQLDQQGFTAVVRAMFAQAGFSSEILPGNPVAGIDLRLQSRDNPAARITRCKHMPSKPVGEAALQNFFLESSAQQSGSCTFVTSSLFTAEAVRFARANGIALLDGGALLRQIAKRSPEQQAALLSLAQDQSTGNANSHGGA